MKCKIVPKRDDRIEMNAECDPIEQMTSLVLKTVTFEMDRLKRELAEVNGKNLTLQTLLRVLNEDLALERQERDKCHEKILELEAENDGLKLRVLKHEREQMQCRVQRREAALAFHRAEYEKKTESTQLVDSFPHGNNDGEDVID